MRDRSFLVLAGLVAFASMTSMEACTLDSMGEGAIPQAQPHADASLGGSGGSPGLGGSGGTQPDAMKDTSIDKPADVVTDKWVPDSADVEVHDAPPDANCFPGTKWCDNGCVETKSPQYGCAQDTCTACSAPNATTKCSNESCAVDACIGLYADCNGQYTDGCETPINTLKDCKSCGLACDPTGATGDCSDGVTCKIAACKAGYADCDNAHGNGCEVFTDGGEVVVGGKVINCGACGQVCEPPAVGTTMKCVKGVCYVDTCTAGTADCDADPSTCEVNTTTDVNNCGVCGKKCAYSHGVGECQAGTCKMVGCEAPYGDCDKSDANGCEVDLSTSPSNCGTCASTCSSVNGSSPSCAEGKCRLNCNTGHLDCNGPQPGSSPQNDGCETPVDANHCGSCAGVCSTFHGTPSCMAGQCVMQCEQEWIDCNGPAVAGTANDDGCQTHRAGDVNNCGACGIVCNSSNGTPSCTNGVCGINCSSGWQNCNGSLSDGCETHTSVDPAACGSCVKVCDGSNGTPSCVNSNCAITCDVGFGNCNGNVDDGCETSLLSSFSHCGACANACLSTAQGHGTLKCDNGACAVVSCQPGFGNCNDDATDGCETSTSTSVAHCGPCPTGCNGACPAACNLPNATPVCTTGACGIGSCIGSRANCDGQTANGCEINTSTDPLNCGACAKACSTNHGAASCSLSACSIACDSGYGNCDNLITNGCETPTVDDPLHCGSCTACPSGSGFHGTPTCVGTTCGIECEDGWGNCNSSLADGCEQVLTTTAHCGSCGYKCNSTGGVAGCTSQGVCTITCTSPAADCNGSVADGCETNTDDNALHCGACFSPCADAKPCVAGKCVP